MVSRAAKMMTPIFNYKLTSRKITRTASKGFTLLELLLVLAIMAMASILVVPNIGNIESRTFSAQIRQATSLLNYARRIAVVRGHPSTASFYVGVEVRGDEQMTRSARDSVGRWDSFGTAVRYRDSTDREIDIDDIIEITFYPEGGSTGGTLLLSQGDRLVSIIVDPFTGRIATEYEEE